MSFTADQMCSKATEAITASRAIRGEIKPLVVSVQASKTETHGKISSAISKNVEQAKIQKVIKKERKKCNSPAGNRTRVFRVTGGDTYHYTTEDLLLMYDSQ